MLLTHPLNERWAQRTYSLLCDLGREGRSTLAWATLLGF